MIKLGQVRIAVIRLRGLIRPPIKPRHYVWHRTGTPFFSIRLANGDLPEPGGRFWRRRVGDRWEYMQDPPTFEEFQETQW